MRIKRVTVTPIAFKDPPLLNASGIREISSTKLIKNMPLCMICSRCARNLLLTAVSA